MTPECPKGPEREARPLCNCETCQREAAAKNASIPYLRRQLAELIFDALEESRRARVFLPELTKEDADAAAAAVVGLVSPELERLTAEVERLQVELGTIRGEMADFAQESVPSHVSTLQAVRWLIAEHDEQVKHNDEVGKENRALCNERDEWKRAAEAETQGRQMEVSRLREQLAAQTQDNAALIAAKLRELGVVDPDDDTMPVFWEHEKGYDSGIRHWTSAVSLAQKLAEMVHRARGSATSEASPIVHSVLLSSDTGVMGEWQAFCSGCEQRSKGDLAHAEFWKDQHLADTLTNESFISPQQAADELSRETQEVFEGRPSGSKAAAPRPGFAPGDRVRWNGETGWFEGFIVKATEPRDVMWAEKWDVKVADGGTFYTNDKPAPRDGIVHVEEQALTLLARAEDAAQAARSEATRSDSYPRIWREGDHEPIEEGLVLSSRDGATWWRKANGEWKSSAGYAMATWVGLMCHKLLLTEVLPSPSLRKEGEDSDNH